MGRKKHFLAGLGNVAINAADRWWEKEKTREQKSKIDGSLDNDRETEAAMEDEIMGGY